MKKHVNIVFVVLVYRNTTDLKDFFFNFTVEDSKVIVVESFYSESCTLEFESIAKDNNSDFISVPNKGYGAGNNKGCKYALEHYKFNYLVISNADVIIKQFSESILSSYVDAIVAPKIINLRGKNQNPSSPFKPGIFLEKFALWLYNGNHTRLIMCYFAMSRMKKIVFYCTNWISKRIFSAHGAFVIIPYSVLRNLYPLYNEEMFLFNEEEHLGRLAALHGVRTYYEPRIKILHKEDGSMKIASINEFERMKQSFLIYYNYWNSHP